jgi:hypothetical protein
MLSLKQNATGMCYVRLKSSTNARLSMRHHIEAGHKVSNHCILTKSIAWKLCLEWTFRLSLYNHSRGWFQTTLANHFGHQSEHQNFQFFKKQLVEFGPM